MKSSDPRARATRPSSCVVPARRRSMLPLFLFVAFVASVATSPGLAAQRTDSSTVRVDSARRMEKILITAIRASDVAPIAQRTIPRAEIVRRQFGQDVPLLLANSSPALTAHTETGTNWGYSYLRLRGVDQTRINITIDGVPLNDMEDQVLYFANFADLMSNVQSVQVQRGVGTSSAGTASYAGSINFETAPLAQRSRGGDLQLQLGTYGAQRISGAFHSGLVNDRFAIYGRAGALRTNGYRDHSGVRGGSGFVGAGWFGNRDIIKLTALVGELADTLSYVGATLEELRQNRRYNPLDPGELDRFGQQMVALSYTRVVNAQTSVNTTAYRNSASGNYDYSYGTDRYRYHLAHAWYGVSSALNHERGPWRLNLGVNANTYAREHSAYLRPDPAALYVNTGHKEDVSGFAKASYQVGRLRWFADLQARHANFRYEPDPGAGVMERAVSWNFLNPKGGVTLQLTDGLQAFASYGATTREPARNDLIAGDDDLNSGNVATIGDFRRVRPESVRDVEAGITLARPGFDVQANLYQMDFRRSIERIGAPTASGLVPRRNVGAAYRRGVEVDASWRRLPRWTLSANLWLSANRIREFADSTVEPVVVRHNVAPLLTPSFVSVHRAEFAAAPSLTLAVEGRYQARAFLDNTGDVSRTLPATYLLDASARLTRARYAVVVRGANLGNNQNFGSGSVSSAAEVRYFVLAGRSVFVTVEIGY